MQLLEDFSLLSCCGYGVPVPANQGAGTGETTTSHGPHWPSSGPAPNQQRKLLPLFFIIFFWGRDGRGRAGIRRLHLLSDSLCIQAIYSEYFTITSTVTTTILQQILYYNHYNALFYLLKMPSVNNTSQFPPCPGPPPKGPLPPLPK